MARCQLPTGEYPEATVLPTVNGRYDWDNLVLQALVDKSHRPFALNGYFVFRFPDSAKEQLLLASSVVSAPLMSSGYIVVSERVRTNPTNIAVDLLVHDCMEDDSFDVSEPTNASVVYSKFAVSNEDIDPRSFDPDSLVTVNQSVVSCYGYSSLDCIPVDCELLRLEDDTLLSSVLKSGLIVKSSSEEEEYDFRSNSHEVMDPEQHLMQSSLGSYASPLLLQGTPGAIHSLHRQHLDMFGVMIHVSGEPKIVDVFSHTDMVLLDELMDEIPDGDSKLPNYFSKCNSRFHHRYISVILGRNAKQVLSPTRFLLEPGMILVTLPGTAVQAFDVGFNTVMSFCLANNFSLPYMMSLDQCMCDNTLWQMDVVNLVQYFVGGEMHMWAEKSDEEQFSLVHFGIFTLQAALCKQFKFDATSFQDKLSRFWPFVKVQRVEKQKPVASVSPSKLLLGLPGVEDSTGETGGTAAAAVATHVASGSQIEVVMQDAEPITVDFLRQLRRRNNHPMLVDSDVKALDALYTRMQLEELINLSSSDESQLEEEGTVADFKKFIRRPKKYIHKGNYIPYLGAKSSKSVNGLWYHHCNICMQQFVNKSNVDRHFNRDKKHPYAFSDFEEKFKDGVGSDGNPLKYSFKEMHKHFPCAVPCHKKKCLVAHFKSGNQVKLSATSKRAALSGSAESSNDESVIPVSKRDKPSTSRLSVQEEKYQKRLQWERENKTRKQDRRKSRSGDNVDDN